MDPHSSHEPTHDTSTPADAISSETRVTASAVSARPAASQFALLMVGTAGSVMGIAIVLALVWLRGEAEPVHTAPASATPVAAAPTTSPVILESAPGPTWLGQRQATRAFDGSKTITFELEATRDVPTWRSRARPVLVVRCVSRATQTFVILGTSATFEADDDHRTVRVQWDDETAMAQRWETSESGQELFAPDSVAFVRQLARVKRVRFGFTPFNAEPVIAEFAVEGFDKLAGLVASTCGWRLNV